MARHDGDSTARPASVTSPPSTPVLPATSAPGATASGGGRADVWYTDTANALRHATWTGAAWTVETVDGPGADGPGYTTGEIGDGLSALFRNGRPEAWYTDATNGTLRHASWSGSAWRLETVDGPNATTAGHTSDDIGEGSTAVDIEGTAHVWYVTGAGALRHAVAAGSTWLTETLDGPDASGAGRTDDDIGPSLAALAVNGAPNVWYVDDTTGDLRHAGWNGAAWQIEIVDGPGATAPGHTTEEIDPAVVALPVFGTPQLWYTSSSGALRHATAAGDSWQFDVLDGPGAALRGHTGNEIADTLAGVVAGGAPHLWYGDSVTGALRHATWTGTSWQFDALDGPGASLAGHVTDAIGDGAAAATVGGVPHVWYHDGASGDLRHAWWTGKTWQFDVVDGPGSPAPGRTTDGVGDGLAASGTGS